MPRLPLIAALLLSACASPDFYDRAGKSIPADAITACETVADAHTNVAGHVARGALGNGVVSMGAGALCSAVTGGLCAPLWVFLGGGALTGGASGAGEASDEHRDIVLRCLLADGHKVVK